MITATSLIGIANGCFAEINVLQIDNTATQKPGADPGFLSMRRLASTAVWPTELVRVQHLRVTDVGNARIIVEKL